jgi:hypothetical protein
MDRTKTLIVRTKIGAKIGAKEPHSGGQSALRYHHGIAGVVVTIEVSTAPQRSSNRALLHRSAIVCCFFWLPTTIRSRRHQTGDLKPSILKIAGRLGLA